VTVPQESTDVSVEMGRKEAHFAKCARGWRVFKGVRGTGFRELHGGVCPRFGLGEPITQAESATRRGVTQPRINDLLRGRIARFLLDTLVNISAALGRKVTVRLDDAA